MKKGSHHRTARKKTTGTSKVNPKKEKIKEGKESSSPVCYAEHENFRPGFEDLKKK